MKRVILIIGLILPFLFSNLNAQVEQIKKGIDQRMTGLSGKMKNELKLTELIESGYLLPISPSKQAELVDSTNAIEYGLGYAQDDLRDGLVVYATKDPQIFFFYYLHKYGSKGLWALEEPHDLESKRQYVLDFIETGGTKSDLNDVKKFRRLVSMFHSHELWGVNDIFPINEIDLDYEPGKTIESRNDGSKWITFISTGDFVFRLSRISLGKPYDLYYTKVEQVDAYKLPEDLTFDETKTPEYIETMTNVIDNYQYFELTINKDNLWGRFADGYSGRKSANINEIELEMNRFTTFSSEKEDHHYGDYYFTLNGKKNSFYVYSGRPDEYDWDAASSNLINITPNISYGLTDIEKDIEKIKTKKKYSEKDEKTLHKIAFMLHFNNFSSYDNVSFDLENYQLIDELDGKYIVQCEHGKYILGVKIIKDYNSPTDFTPHISSYKELRVTDVEYVKGASN